MRRIENYHGAINRELDITVPEGERPPRRTQAIVFVDDESRPVFARLLRAGTLGMWLYFTVSAEGEAGVRGL